MNDSATHAAVRPASTAAAETARDGSRDSLPTVSPPPAARSRRHRMAALALAALIAGLAGYAAWDPGLRQKALELYHRVRPEPSAKQPAAPLADSLPNLNAPWDGTVAMTRKQAETIGLTVSPVRPVTQPLRVEIYGKTAYDPNSLAQIRPRFTSVVDQVHVALGQRVRPGDPLIELYSADLAAAKSDFEKTQARWEHDQKELERAERLRKTEPPAISERDYLSLVNDEKVSRTEAKVAVDKLLVYGLTPEAIARVSQETGTEKARLEIRANTSGVVIRRAAVQGNLYNTDDVLLVIAPIDHLRVYGHVYPSDANQISAGQRWIVRLPGSSGELTTQVDAIASELDPESNTFLIRGTIPNLNGSVKSDMLVGGYVEVPPPTDSVQIPRRALISSDGDDYAFVQTEPGPQEPKSAENPDEILRFERRKVRVAIERNDVVIALAGLQPGERVSCRGALILSQLYEDAEASRPALAQHAAADPDQAAGGDLTAPK